MKRILALIFVSALLLSALPSCGAALDEEGVRAVAAPLIEASFEINDIFFGDGLAHEGDASFDNYVPDGNDSSKYDVKPVQYLVVTDDRFLSIDDLKEAARAVYTDAYLANVFKIAFEGMTQGDGTVYQYPRYVSNVIGTLSVRSDAAEENNLKNRTYDLSTVKVTGGSKNLVYFTVQSYVDGAQDVTVRLSLRDEGNGWRLDSPTY